MENTKLDSMGEVRQTVVKIYARLQEIEDILSVFVENLTPVLKSSLTVVGNTEKEEEKLTELGRDLDAIYKTVNRIFEFIRDTNGRLEL